MLRSCSQRRAAGVTPMAVALRARVDACLRHHLQRCADRRDHQIHPGAEAARGLSSETASTHSGNIMKIILPLVAAALLGLADAAQARSLDAIRESGTLGLCAHPNSLPFASKAGDPPGFQIELGQALARELGVTMRPDWIITQYQMRSAGCDIVLDVIADREAQGETNLALSKPYYRTGVVLAVPTTSKLASFQSLDEHTKVGVQVGSVAAMTISQRHVPT